MAVIEFVESPEGRSISAVAGEGMEYRRTFWVTVDSPNTSLLEIMAAPGVYLWAPHPDDSAARAQSFNARPRGSNSLSYVVSVDYQPVPRRDAERAEQKPGATKVPSLPSPVWSGGSARRQVPFVKDSADKPVLNSAGVPFDGISKDDFYETLALVKCYATLTDALTAIRSVLGFTNNDAIWADGVAGEWLCSDARWNVKDEPIGNDKYTYVEVSYSFEHSKGGWAYKLLDIGYRQKVDADGNPSETGTQLAAILDNDGKPVREPVALNGKGVVMSPPTSPTNPPLVINSGNGVRPFKGAIFKTILGEPLDMFPPPKP